MTSTPLFSKRHYEWLAARLGACCEDQDNLFWIAERFAADLAVDNPRFQPDRFLERVRRGRQPLRKLPGERAPRPYKPGRGYP